MKLKLAPKFILTFLALTFVMHEAHEIAHTTVGRIICGCWGQRDFNVWSTCESCATNSLESLATAAGPLFTFLMIWYGSLWLDKNKTDNQKALGFSLVFANMPIMRLLNPVGGGGDEVVVINHFLHHHGLSRLIAAILIIVIIAYPLYKAYQLIENKYKMGWFLLFFLLPTTIDVLIVVGLMNTLLEKGLWDTYWILGSPILVTVWTLLVVSIYLLTGKNIYSLVAGSHA